MNQTLYKLIGAAMVCGLTVLVAMQSQADTKNQFIEDTVTTQQPLLDEKIRLRTYSERRAQNEVICTLNTEDMAVRDFIQKNSAGAYATMCGR